MDARSFFLFSCLAIAPAVCLQNCVSKGNLGDRLRTTIRENDINNDGVVTLAEIYEDGTLRYDWNKDGCVSLPEFVVHWVRDVHFSPGFAYKRLFDISQGNINLTCAFPFKDFKDDQTVALTLEVFRARNLQSLIDFCEADPSQYNFNCDCLQLPDMCRTDSYYSPLPQCVQFLQNYSGK